MDILRDIYLYYYCLPIWQVVIWVAGAVGIFLLLQRFFRGSAWWRRCVGIAAGLWGGVILLCTLLRNPGTGEGVLLWVPFHSYFSVLTGGNPELLRTNFMNTLLFVPLGLLGGELLPRDWTLKKRLIFAACFALALSCGIEIIQFVSRRGYAEMDDIIHNTAGICLGVLTTGHHANPAKREVGCNE